MEAVSATSKNSRRKKVTGIRLVKSDTQKKLDTTPKKQTVKSNGENGLKKQYLKNNICKVTFRLSKDAARNAKKVNLVGDFNNWDISKANKMTRLKNGSHTAIINLECGKEYQFRYLIDNIRWENDWNADRYAKNPFGDDNSVIAL